MAGVWYFLFLGKVSFTSVVILRHILLINYTACRRNVPQSHKYGGPPMNLELGITYYNSTGWLRKKSQYC